MQEDRGRIRARIAEIAEDVRGGLPPRLLEAVALRLDAAWPDAPAEALSEFLSAKGDDWQEFHDRLDSIGSDDAAVDRIGTAAKTALARADFTATDARLAELEQLLAAGSDRAASARLHAGRASALLLKGDVHGAADSIEAAAALLLPFAPDEAAGVRHAASRSLYNDGLHMGGAGLARAVELLRSNEAIWNRDDDPDGWLKTQVCLVLVLWQQGATTEGAAGAALLAEADTAQRATLDAISREGRPRDWAMAQQTRGELLLAQAGRSDEAERLTREALAAFAASRTLPVSDLPEDWAETQFEHGKMMLNRAMDVGDQTSRPLFADAVAAFRIAIGSVRAQGDVVFEAAANCNLGLALAHLSAFADRAEGIPLLDEAATAYRASLDAFSREQFPDSWAVTQRNLGIALAMRAGYADGEADAALAAEALAAFRAALEVFTPREHPNDWARTQYHLGVLFEAQGDGQADSPILSYRQSLACFDAVLALDEASVPDDVNAVCAFSRKRVAAKMPSAENRATP